YLDNILIFSKTIDKYQKYIKVVLDALYAYKLLVNKEKSKFYIRETVFSRYEISLGQIRIKPLKVKVIKN
ncbi:hypothetical protein MYCTH_2069219, partial [Thermothelomyces thermophilus ATCC 42464]